MENENIQRRVGWQPIDEMMDQTTPETQAAYRTWRTSVISQPPPPLPPGPRSTTPSGLTIIEVQPGAGPEAKSGDRVTVHYVGTLLDATLRSPEADNPSVLEAVLASVPVPR